MSLVQLQAMGFPLCLFAITTLLASLTAQPEDAQRRPHRRHSDGLVL
ncbi:hypothetical protein [Paracoccus aminovorans]|nr:hypothetical protein [Paracoccus aminovorans]